MVPGFEDPRRGLAPPSEAPLKPRVGHDPRVECALEAQESVLEVAEVVEEPLGLEHQVGLVAEVEPQPVGEDLLHRAQQLGVAAELYQEVRLCRPGQLGVPRLVMEVAEGGASLYSKEKIREAVEGAVLEVSLVNHLDPGAHGLERLLGARPVLRDLDYPTAFGQQALEEPLFVLDAGPLQEPELWVVRVRGQPGGVLMDDAAASPFQSGALHPGREV